MIHIKTPEELAKMREAGRIVALAHDAVRTSIRAGMTSRELNAICERVITEAGATPSFKGLYGFPAAACISINDLLVHGIPDDAIGEYVFAHGCSIPRDYTGHGVGREVHEDPAVPNFGPAGHGVLLKPGMTIAVEPMVIAGRPQTRTLKDGWGVVTRDGSRTAHFEHTVAIANDGYEILTTLKKEEHPENG